jgi:acetyl-CoA acyltransferase
MSSAVIVDCVRTAIGRSHAVRGVFRQVRSEQLAAACLRALIERAAIDPAAVEDVVLGCARQTREQGMNVARIAALLAGLPAGTAAVTVNRLCGSGLQAIQQAAHAIQAGAENVQLVGGVEHMHHLPLGSEIDPSPRLFRHMSRASLNMGLTAEHLSRKFGISRQAQDAFACRSHQLAAAAAASGDWDREIVPVAGHDQSGLRITVARDQCVRPDIRPGRLAQLRSAFGVTGGTVTAGNSAPQADGAAALLMMSEDRALRWGLRPLVRVRATAVAGVEPCLMGLGPVAASEKALRRAGLTLADMDLIELNEAYAVQVLACLRQWGLSDQQIDRRVNPCGGAIALGNPLGASGARIATTLIRQMVARDARFGLAAMCVGLGQGVATIFERRRSSSP